MYCVNDTGVGDRGQQEELTELIGLFPCLAGRFAPAH
jgi:hypothetical protein